MSGMDSEAMFLWVADALVRAYSGGHATLVVYLESVLEEVLWELELSKDP